MSTATLEQLLTAGEYATCERMAVKFLEGGDHSPATKAMGNLLLGRARIGQENYSAAIEPAHMATFIAREHGLHDVLGKALDDLGYAFFYMGHYAESARAYREFLRHEELYSEELRATAPRKRRNLGAALRSSGNHEEATACFREAWQQLETVGDVHGANEARYNLLWEYLHNRQPDQARELLDAGEAYVARYPERTADRVHQLCDTGQYHYLRGQYPEARAASAAALELAEAPEQRAEAELVLARVALAVGEVLPAFCTVLSAKQDAEAARRDDLVGQADSLLDDIVLRHEREVLAFVRENTGFRPKEER